MSVVGRAFVVWLAIIAAESVHGTLRELFLAPAVGDFRARQIAVFSGMAIIFLVTWLAIRWIGAKRTGTLLAIGGLWVVLTLAFEFALGAAMGLSRERMLSDYDIARGGLMPLGLVALFLTPWAAARLRTPRHASSAS